MQKLGGRALRVVNIRSSEASCISGKCLQAFVGRCPNLLSLSMTGENEVASDKDVLAIVTNCPLLETLELGSRCQLTDVSFMRLISLPLLKSLSLDWGSTMTREAARAFFQSRGPYLEVLNLNVTEEEKTLFDDILLSIGCYCSRLRAFKCLSECRHITKGGVLAIVRGCPLLESLNIQVLSSKWNVLDDAVMVALADSCPRLRTVSLSDRRSSPKFTDTGLVALSRGCPDLTELDLDRNHTVGDAAILSLAEHCHKLQSVTLFANGLLTSSAVCALLETNPDITSITLIGGRLISDNVSQSLMRGRRQLRTLTLECCQNTSEESLVALLSGCRSLESLSLDGSGSAAVSDTLIEVVIQHCSQLRSILLFDCPYITGRSVASLIQSRTRITQVSIDDCGLREDDTTSKLYKSDIDVNGDDIYYIDISRPNRHMPWVVDVDDTKHCKRIERYVDRDNTCLISRCLFLSLYHKYLNVVLYMCAIYVCNTIYI